MRKVDVRHCSWISFAKLMSSVRIRRLRRHILQLMFPIDVSTCFWRRSRHVQWHSSEFYGVVNLRSQFTSASDFIFRYKNSRYARRNCVTHQLLANCWAHDTAHDRQPCLFKAHSRLRRCLLENLIWISRTSACWCIPHTCSECTMYIDSEHNYHATQLRSAIE